MASVAVLTFSLVTQQGTLGASIDDDVPIHKAVEESAAVEESSLNENKEQEDEVEISISGDNTNVKVVVEQRPVSAVKNQAPYVSSGIDPEVQMKVYTYFSDIPEMIYVAECESTFRHYETNGEVLRGRAVSADVGVMQINEYYHLEDSRRAGYDIHTLEGNLDYARHLYEKQGLQPWSASRPCWSAKHAAAGL